mmetsp:Transcript_8347/g.25886  ORF Transcript_8347/g.25886 Transcript_8347/m.25886 type:complete len:152 (-) Transcript_8347:38-493(-)
MNFVAFHLRRNFDFVGLSELRAAALVMLLRQLNVRPPDELYAGDCKRRDNVALDTYHRRLVAANERCADAPYDESPSAAATKPWSRHALPPVLLRFLEAKFSNAVRFYRFVRDYVWCDHLFAPTTVQKVLGACPHPYSFVSYQCRRNEHIG